MGRRVVSDILATNSHKCRRMSGSAHQAAVRRSFFEHARIDSSRLETAISSGDRSLGAMAADGGMNVVLGGCDQRKKGAIAMKRICAWCGHPLDDGTYGGELVTHGVCPDCRRLHFGRARSAPAVD